MRIRCHSEYCRATIDDWPIGMDILYIAPKGAFQGWYKAGLDKEIWQYFSVPTIIRRLGVMDVESTYYEAIVLKAVESLDGR